MEGIILLNKPKEYTSFDVIARLRGMSKVKRVGHSGTLDPMATGVLPIFFGKATKACDILPDDKKEYIAEFVLGYKSNTLDIHGEVSFTGKTNFSYEDINETIQCFIGDIFQIPPMYSAVSINGQRLYDMARQGIEVVREPRPVTFHEIELLDFSVQEQRGHLRLLCSKGTYIRTLCDDLGAKLNSGCIMGELVRTLSNGFTLDKCITIDEAQELTQRGELSSVLIPIDSIFSTYPKLFLSEKQAKMMLNGVDLDLNKINYKKNQKIYSVYDDKNKFLALAMEELEDFSLKIIKRFA